jgi:uncharacterized OB-fold protein
MTANFSLANADSKEYWHGAKERRLLFQRCRRCSAVQFPPRNHCASCWEADLEWTESSGSAIVESFTVVRRAPVPAFREKVPYIVAAVLVEEGPRMITNIVGEDALELKIGDAVKVEFADDGAGNVLPLFRRA